MIIIDQSLECMRFYKAKISTLPFIYLFMALCSVFTALCSEFKVVGADWEPNYQVVPTQRSQVIPIIPIPPAYLSAELPDGTETTTAKAKLLKLTEEPLKEKYQIPWNELEIVKHPHTITAFLGKIFGGSKATFASQGENICEVFVSAASFTAASSGQRPSNNNIYDYYDILIDFLELPLLKRTYCFSS